MIARVRPLLERGGDLVLIRSRHAEVTLEVQLHNRDLWAGRVPLD
jgi:hypothetical protein